jgi:MFS transporter, DHA2 family, methylenomycin A resistance protein
MSSRRLLLVVMCVGYFLVLLDVTVVNVALPTIAHDLDTSVPGLQAVVVGYTVALAALLLPAGAYGDRLGHRPVVLAGLAVVGLGSLGCGLAPTTDVLVATRVVQGLGAAVLLPGTLATIADAHPDPTARARAIAVWAAIGSVALPAGPLVGGLLVEAFGWRSVFLVNVPVVLVSGLVVARIAPRGRPAVREGRGVRSALALFRRPAFATANVVAGAMNFGSVALLFLTSLYLQDVQHRTAAEAGLAMVPATLPLAVVPPLAGRWVARRGPAPAAATGLLLAAVGVGLLATWHSGTSYAGLLPALVIWGCGLGMLTPAVVTAAVAAAPPDRSGLASGVNNTARQAGGALGIAAYGALAGSPTEVGHFLAGLHAAGIATCVLYAVAATASVRWLPRSPGSRGAPGLRPTSAASRSPGRPEEARR